MRKTALVGGGLVLLVGIALGRLLGAGERRPEQAVQGEVRGAPLRSAPDARSPEPAQASQPERSTQATLPEDAASGTKASGSQAVSSEEYAGLLPPGEAAKFPWIDFELLSDFEYLEPAERESASEVPELPEEVRALHGKLVALEGFMNPLAFDAGGVSEFTLVSDPTFCCFGRTPKLNHFVHVTLPEGKRSDFHSMVPIAVFGRLSVGELEEDGFVLSLYRCEAEHVLSTY